MTCICVGVAIALSLLTLRLGFFLDDYMQLALELPPSPPLFELAFKSG